MEKLSKIFFLQSYCVTEPVAGSDVAGIQTKAEKKGDEVVYLMKYFTQANVQIVQKVNDYKLCEF